MKRYTYLLFISSLVLLFSCGHDENKTDTQETRPPAEKVKPAVPDSPQTPATAAPVKPVGKDPDEILTGIDKYIVCSAAYDKPSAGTEGISNCLLTVQNKLNDYSFEKVMAEVSILLADGKEYRTDYYTIINLGPGESKVVKIPNTTRGTEITSHIIKVKSDKLTGGEFILTGSRYTPK